jgi:hypothetical protein
MSRDGGAIGQCACGFVFRSKDVGKPCSGCRTELQPIRPTDTFSPPPEPSPGGDSWYRQGGVEPVDFLLTNFPEGYKVPAIEYIFRAGNKPGVPEALDIEKAMFWLNKRLEQLRGAD